MPPELKKILPVDMRSLGLDEKWLQDQISEDPGILGLGDLEIASREHRQPVGGRIDFLMHDDEAETYYEVEVMLGELNAMQSSESGDLFTCSPPDPRYGTFSPYRSQW
jgi:hypothetical protein